MAREKAILDPKLIIDTTFEIIDSSGFSDFSSRKLASRLGVSHMTIYNYFSREELLGKVIKRGFNIFHQMMDRDALEYLRSGKDPVGMYLILTDKMVIFAKKHRYLYRFMFTEESTSMERLPEVRHEYYSAQTIMKKYIDEAVYEDFCRDSNLFLLLVNVIILSFLDGRHGMTEDSCRENILRAFDKLMGCYRRKKPD